MSIDGEDEDPIGPRFTARLPGARILLLEDNDAFAESITAILKKHGVRDVVRVTAGEQALKRATAERFDGRCQTKVAARMARC